MIFFTIAVPLISADALRAGAAQSVITPELNGPAVYLAGFGHNRVATGMHGDLFARCLALGTAKQTLVVCSVDLIGLFYDDVLTVRRAFQQVAPAESVLIVLQRTPTPDPTRWAFTVPSRWNRVLTGNTWTGSTSASPRPRRTLCAPCGQRY